MKTIITLNKQSGSRWLKPLTGIFAAGLLAVGLTGCDTTKQVSETPKDFSGFLGDYSMLEKGEKGMANYVYFDHATDWSKYTKIYIKNIDLWKSNDPDSPFGKMSPEQQQMLVNFLHTALDNSLRKNFEIVDHAGPDTLVIHGALTEAKKSWPVLNLVSTVYPAALLISYGKQAITGTGSFVGKVMIEADFTDGVTGKRVAAAVDERAGTKALRTKFDGSWGDVKLSFDWWADRLDERLNLLKTGDYTNKSL
jgi:Protein of unknown function (DUF3313)